MSRKLNELMGATANVAPTKGEGTQAPTQPRSAPGQVMQFAVQRDAAIDRAEKAEEELKFLKDGMEIDVDLCDEVPGRRRKLSEQEYADLKANLSKNPLEHPIIVRKKPDGRYEIISGANRRAIFKELGRAKIPAFIKNVDDAAAETGAFYANLLQTSLPDYEKYVGFKEWQERTGLMQIDMAEKSGLDKSVISKLFCFDELPDAAKKILRERPHILGTDAATKMAKVAKEKESRVAEAIQKLANDPSFTQAQAVAYLNERDTQKKEAPKPIVINQGKKKVCELKYRDGNLGISFAHKDPAKTEEWAKKIEAFIRSQMEAEG